MGVKQKFKKLLLKRSPVSTAGVNPGDVLVFNYIYTDKYKRNKSYQRLALVVRTQRGPGGTFISTRNNKLLSCFNLGEKSEGTVTIILDQLYKNSKDSSYTRINENQIKGLKALLGKQSFRTFNFTKIKKLFKARRK